MADPQVDEAKEERQRGGDHPVPVADRCVKELLSLTRSECEEDGGRGSKELNECAYNDQDGKHNNNRGTLTSLNCEG